MKINESWPDHEGRITQGVKANNRGRLRWGPMPLPKGAEIIGEYKDNTRMGAAIRLDNGRVVCGACGVIGCIESAPIMILEQK